MDSQLIGFGLDWTALNMFGSKGNIPITSIFASDQFTYGYYPLWWWDRTGLQAWQHSFGASFQLLGLALEGSANQNGAQRKEAMFGLLDLAAPGTLTLSDMLSVKGFNRNSGSDHIVNNTAIALAWGIDIPELRPQILNKKQQSVTFLYNRESLAFSIQNLGSDPPEIAANISAIVPTGQYTASAVAEGTVFTLSHDSYLVLPGIGYGNASLSLGMYFSKTSKLIFAIQGKIEARITL